MFSDVARGTGKKKKGGTLSLVLCHREAPAWGEEIKEPTDAV